NQSNVLLFHKRDIQIDKLPTVRNPNQIWLLWNDEANEKALELNKVLFNWTITYRFSAEASLSAYGITLLKPQPLTDDKFNSWINSNFINRRNLAICCRITRESLMRLKLSRA
ncbi:unnamed protein product, partial [Didymodactylos carnosus]